MPILNIAGYKFIPLTELASLQQQLLLQAEALSLKGTILLSHEGINITLAGLPKDIAALQTFLKSDSLFADITFHESYSKDRPFKRLNVKLKNEIITLRQKDVSPATTKRAPLISPDELKQWLDEKRDFTLLDTRNHYEVRFGTFKDAKQLHIADFGELPCAIAKIERDKPIVMFCTGGIRCEKAALHMMNQGYSDVRQLDGGILGYFREMGGAHYEGECFVFDQRIAVDSALQHAGTTQCEQCEGPITPTQLSCSACHL